MVPDDIENEQDDQQKRPDDQDMGEANEFVHDDKQAEMI